MTIDFILGAVVALAVFVCGYVRGIHDARCVTCEYEQYLKSVEMRSVDPGERIHLKHKGFTKLTAEFPTESCSDSASSGVNQSTGNDNV